MESFKGKRILIADDEDLIREILKEMFEFEGAKVLEASSGRKALELLRKNPVDIVITDVRMPDGDGIGLAKSISLEIKNPPKIFFFTGYSDVNLEDVSKYGVLDIISKPVLGKSLTDRILERL